MTHPSLQPDLSQSIRREVLGACAEPGLWIMLGWADIRQRYRRSKLGPFWITLSMAMFIGVLGVIYSKIFNLQIATYLPFLTAGYVIWGFISQTVNESCGAFQEGDRIIKQIRLPYAIYVFRVVWRNFLVFLHTVVLFVPVALIFGLNPGASILLVFPGLLLLCVNLTWIAISLAVVATRYRDITHVVTTGTQIILFATPIMWPVSTLGTATWIANVNPLYHFIDIVRGPLLGIPPATLSWAVSVGAAIGGAIVAALLLRRASYRLVFWL
jgi:ABC-type polysaccharide/polyol phosphate export permease